MSGSAREASWSSCRGTRARFVPGRASKRAPSVPVVEHLETTQKCVHRIDALQSIDDVFAATCKVVDAALK